MFEKLYAEEVKSGGAATLAGLSPVNTTAPVYEPLKGEESFWAKLAKENGYPNALDNFFYYYAVSIK